MSRTLLTLSLAVLAVAGLAPVAVMILRVVQDPAALQGLLDERTLSLLGRTLLLGGGAAGLALLVGAPFGYLTARTDLPGATWLRSLGLVPLIMPPLLLAVSWTVLVPQLRGAPHDDPAHGPVHLPYRRSVHGQGRAPGGWAPGRGRPAERWA